MRSYTLFLALFITTPILAEERYSCMDQAAHRQFDFWVGSWQVTNKDGDKTYGTNTITIEEAGCLLRESWQSASGSTGSSINYFSPADGKWHQHWIDSGSSIITIAGTLVEGSMAMSGDIYYLGEARRAEFRGLWTPLPDGSVRQFFEEQDAKGQWQTWFEGFYHPWAGTKLP